MPVGDILVRRCCYRVLLAPPVGNSRSYSAPPGRLRANPFGEVPTARGLRRVLEMLELRRNVDIEHELRAKYHRIYGPIYRYRFLGRNVVSVNDAAAVETLHRVDGRCPRRYVPAQWQGWRAERGIPCGILTESAGEWRRMRSALDKVILKQNTADSCAAILNDRTNDLITRLRESANHGVVHDLQRQLFRWSLDCICGVLFGRKRLTESEREQFISAVEDMTSSLDHIELWPRWLSRIVQPANQRLHDNGWQTIHELGERLVNRNRDNRTGRCSGLIGRLFVDDTISHDEVHANIAELMAGAVDTTAHTAMWAIQHLSESEMAQERLRSEVEAVLATGEIQIGGDHLNKMSYIKAIVKEITRLYPPIYPTRVTQTELTLCSYRIPADTVVIVDSFSMGRNPRYFSNPESWSPDRWLDRTTRRAYPFASVPFGYGARMCIGRRIGEMEIYILLSRLVQCFRLLPTGVPRPQLVTRTLLVPNTAAGVMFVLRQLEA